MTTEQWYAIRDCKKEYDGQFFYALHTTKNVCRPSCTARTCNPKNVLIFYSLEDALAQGFHPCCRCHPEISGWNGAKNELAQKSKNWIEHHYREKFSLAAIANNLSITPNYLLRAFKECTGKTLLSYHNYIRCEHAKALLTKQDLEISYIANAVGYKTSSHFAKLFKQMIGCTPSEYRKDYVRSFYIL